MRSSSQSGNVPTTVEPAVIATTAAQGFPFQ